ncbi:MAG: condensation domain-containing protein [Luteimonas sp.]
MKSFGLIFVLYHPSEEFLQNLAKARAICPDVVAVDNSPEADLPLHERLREQGMQVIFNCNDGGLAGAYNKGAELLLARACEVIFLLDQDSDIDASFFDKMMQGCESLDTELFLVGPKIYEVNLQRCMPSIPPGKRFPKMLRIDERTEGLFPTLFIISSGSAISAQAYRKLGAFKEEYFIEYIDIEYGLRASSQGVPVYMNAAVTMRQTTGHIERHGKLFTTNHVAWRRYYGARNAVHCLRLYRELWGLHWLSGLLAIHQGLCVLLFEPQKRRKITAIACGYFDGLFGNLGTFESQHPRIAAYCKNSGRQRVAVETGTSAAANPSHVMKRKLSTLEHMIDGNVGFFVRLEGQFELARLRSAIDRVQAKHPALRALIGEDSDGLHYLDDRAPQIPLRVVPRTDKDDYRREFITEIMAVFPHDMPQLRVAWLSSAHEQDLLLVGSHRICDGMSMLVIVREILRALYSDEALVTYTSLTVQDIIGDYQPPSRWKRKLVAGVMNGVIRLIPATRKPPVNQEYSLEWSAGNALTVALKQRCKAEGVSIHSTMLVALDRALSSVLGKKKVPYWIESPINARGGRRLAALKKDMLFFGGGSLKIRTGAAAVTEFWANVRTGHEGMRAQIGREILDIPNRYHLSTLLRPPSREQIQSIVRLGDALKVNGSWNRFALSNLGNVELNESDAPFRVKDLRLHVHSFSVRLLGIIAYTLNGELRFHYMGDEKCMSRAQADSLQREFMDILLQHATQARDVAAVPRLLSAVAAE